MQVYNFEVARTLAVGLQLAARNKEIYSFSELRDTAVVFTYIAISYVTGKVMSDRFGIPGGCSHTLLCIMYRMAPALSGAVVTTW